MSKGVITLSCTSNLVGIRLKHVHCIALLSQTIEKSHLIYVLGPKIERLYVFRL